MNRSKKDLFGKMPYIIYGGLRYNQIRHAIYCKNCKDVIESRTVHDFKYCSCGSVAIDGGILAGNRILGNLCDIETRSIYCAVLNGKTIWLPQTVIEQEFAKLNNAHLHLWTLKSTHISF
jgi:hypothetical protein